VLGGRRAAARWVRGGSAGRLATRQTAGGEPAQPLYGHGHQEARRGSSSSTEQEEEGPLPCAHIQDPPPRDLLASPALGPECLLHQHGLCTGTGPSAVLLSLTQSLLALLRVPGPLLPGGWRKVITTGTSEERRDGDLAQLQVVREERGFHGGGGGGGVGGGKA